MTESAPVLAWFRRDLRLADNPALASAAATGRPVIPFYVLDETPGVRGMGAASRWWLDKSLLAFGSSLQAAGSQLVLRRGEAADEIIRLVRETGASGVYWNRLYDPAVVERDAGLKTALTDAGVEAESFSASLLNEPWMVKTKGGEPFKVFGPYWRAARTLVEAVTIPAPRTLRAPDVWPRGDRLTDWALHPKNPDWSDGFQVWTPGELGAAGGLYSFLDEALANYPQGRNLPGQNGSSRLSPHLHWGEIGPRQIWRAVHDAAAQGAVGDTAAETFLAELGWREFNHQLLFHHPDLAQASVRPAFDGMAWRKDPADLEAWRRGRTGYPIVDAGMRQLWTTGWMHNRVRMIVASFLIKHLLIDWREGERWFWDTLVDADEANNAANWQWVAGSGADASPFFRIFNPTLQGEKFDPDGDYVRQWIPELADTPARDIHTPGVGSYARPVVEHGQARRRALDALAALRVGSG